MASETFRSGSEQDPLDLNLTTMLAAYGCFKHISVTDFFFFIAGLKPGYALELARKLFEMLKM